MASTSRMRQALVLGRSTIRTTSGPAQAGASNSSSSSSSFSFSLPPLVARGQRRHSHVGRAAIPVPESTSVSILPFAPVANPTRRQPRALAQARSIRIQGPLGTVLVPLQDFVNVAWDMGKGQTQPVVEVSEQTELKTTSPGSATITTSGQRLTLAIADVQNKKERSMWGLTRALIANAIDGVQEGHVAVLRLVGVGYRAVVETDPFPRPDAFEVAFQEAAPGASTMAQANFDSPQQLAYYADIVNAAKAAGQERKRIALRLGYAHVINLPVPRGLSCTTPAPNRIIIKGSNKEQVGLFASRIRSYRPPEPYKGKGVFVNDETIRLKSPRKK